MLTAGAWHQKRILFSVVPAPHLADGPLRGAHDVRTTALPPLPAAEAVHTAAKGCLQVGFCGWPAALLADRPLPMRRHVCKLAHECIGCPLPADLPAWCLLGVLESLRSVLPGASARCPCATAARQLVVRGPKHKLRPRCLISAGACLMDCRGEAFLRRSPRGPPPRCR